MVVSHDGGSQYGVISHGGYWAPLLAYKMLQEPAVCNGFYLMHDCHA